MTARVRQRIPLCGPNEKTFCQMEAARCWLRCKLLSSDVMYSQAPDPPDRSDGDLGPRRPCSDDAHARRQRPSPAGGRRGGQRRGGGRDRCDTKSSLTARPTASLLCRFPHASGSCLVLPGVHGREGLVARHGRQRRWLPGTDGGGAGGNATPRQPGLDRFGIAVNAEEITWWCLGSLVLLARNPSTCINLVGAVGLEPTNPSLVRRVLYH